MMRRLLAILAVLPLLLGAAQRSGTPTPTSDVSQNRVTATGSTTARSLAARAADVVNVKDFGAKGDGVTNDAASVQAALTAAASASKTVAVPSGTYVIASGVTVPSGAALDMQPGAEFLYTGTGTAVTIDTSERKRHRVAVRRDTIGWHTGADTTSIGLTLRNTNWSDVEVVLVQGFWKGLNLYGNGAGTCYNTVRVGRIVNNKIGVTDTMSPAYPASWANGNTFIGGAVRIDSAYSAVAGSVLVDAATMNGTQFLGVNLEGTAPETTMRIASTHNVVIGCRFEQGPKVLLTSTASANLILGGYDNLGPGSKVAQNPAGAPLFDDQGVANVIVGGRGLKLAGDSGTYGGDALILEGLTGASDVVLRTQRYSDQKVYARLTATGTLSLYDSPGDSIAGGAINPVLVLDAVNDAISTGKADGSVAPTALIGAWDATRADLKKALVANGGPFASVVGSVSGASLAVGTGNVFKVTQGGATTVTALTGGTTGQTAILIAGDSNSTIQNNAGLKLAGAANWAMTTGDTLTLVLDTGSVWRETSRTDVP